MKRTLRLLLLGLVALPCSALAEETTEADDEADEAEEAAEDTAEAAPDEAAEAAEVEAAEEQAEAAEEQAEETPESLPGDKPPAPISTPAPAPPEAAAPAPTPAAAPARTASRDDIERALDLDLSAEHEAYLASEHKAEGRAFAEYLYDEADDDSWVGIGVGAAAWAPGFTAFGLLVAYDNGELDVSKDVATAIGCSLGGAALALIIAGAVVNITAEDDMAEYRRFLPPPTAATAPAPVAPRPVAEDGATSGDPVTLGYSLSF